MELTYDEIKNFMMEYCADYCRYANDAETMHKMDRYWATDFKAVAYFRRSNGEYPVIYSTRKDFQEFLIKTHRVIRDSLNPVDFIIDERANKVVVLLKIIKTNRQTDEKIEIDGIGCYQLAKIKDGTFKIMQLDFIWNAPDAIKNMGQ